MNYQLAIWDKDLSLNNAFENITNNPIATELVIRELTKRTLIENKFSELNISEPNDADKTNLLNAFKQKSNIANDEMFKQFLEGTDNTEEELLQTLIYQAKIEQIRDQVISEADIREYFLKMRDSKESISFGIARLQDKELAHRIFLQVTEEYADFSELTKKHSIGDNAESGGILDSVPLATVHPTLKEVLSTLRPGEISQPIQGDNNHYLVVQLLGYQRVFLSEQNTFIIKNELFERWLNAKVTEAEPKLNNNNS